MGTVKSLDMWGRMSIFGWGYIMPLAKNESSFYRKSKDGHYLIFRVCVGHAPLESGLKRIILPAEIEIKNACSEIVKTLGKYDRILFGGSLQEWDYKENEKKTRCRMVQCDFVLVIYKNPEKMFGQKNPFTWRAAYGITDIADNAFEEEIAFINESMNVEEDEDPGFD